MKSKLLLIFLVLILSFNIFSNTNSKEKFKLAKTYLDQKNYTWNWLRKKIFMRYII